MSGNSLHPSISLISEPLLTTPEVAEMLAVEEQTVRLWVSRGRIPFLKVGRCTRYDRTVIMQWLKNLNPQNEKFQRS